MSKHIRASTAPVWCAHWDYAPNRAEESKPQQSHLDDDDFFFKMVATWKWLGMQKRRKMQELDGLKISDLEIRGVFNSGSEAER